MESGQRVEWMGGRRYKKQNKQNMKVESKNQRELLPPPPQKKEKRKTFHSTLLVIFL